MGKRECYRLGMSAYHAGRYEKAIELLTPLSSTGSGADELLSRFYLGQSHYRLAMRLFKNQQYAEATRHFQSAARLNASGGGLAKFLVACHVGARQFDLAARELESMVQANPDDAPLRIRLALTQYKQGSPIEAMATLREGICRQPDRAELHYQVGVMLAAEEDFGEAERAFEMAVACDPAHARAHERLAQIYAVQERHERAFQYLQRAHELDPFDTRVAFQLNVLSAAQTGSGHPREVVWHTPPVAPELDQVALDRLGQAIVDEPEFLTAFLSLPESEVDQEVFSTLAATLEAALCRHPEFADLHYHCAAVYERLGRRHSAIEHTERAVEINPRYVRALILLANLYGQTQQWAMGVERLEQAIRAGGDYADVHCLIGQLCQAGGQPDRARKAYQRALDLNNEYHAASEALAGLPR